MVRESSAQECQKRKEMLMTNQPADRPTNIAGQRVACTRLKIKCIDHSYLLNILVEIHSITWRRTSWSRSASCSRFTLALASFSFAYLRLALAFPELHCSSQPNNEQKRQSGKIKLKYIFGRFSLSL